MLQKKSIAIVVSSLIMGSVTFSAPVLAADAEIELLRAEIARLSARLGALEEQRTAPAAAPKAVEPAAGKKMAKSSKPVIKGDVRYRYEHIDEEGKPTRDRNRVRARVGLSGNVNDSVKAGVQLATGGDSPVSANQSLDTGFSTKDIGLDLAYVTWQATENSSLTAGKMKNPLHRAGGNGLVWDGDLNPEGIAWNYADGSFFANVVGLYVEERSSTDDSLLLGGQVGLDAEVSGDVDVKAGLGYYVYTNTRGNEPFFDGDPGGNTVVGGNLVNDYNEIELFAEVSTRLWDTPARFFANWVHNTEVSQLDSGYAVGAKLGKASAPGTFDFAWIYQDLEADAVIATFTDSDFGGGGTGSDGHILKLKYAVAKNWAAGLTYFLNDIGAPGGPSKDFRRVQADMQFKF